MHRMPVREITDLIVELGLTDTATVHSALTPDELDSPLDDFGDTAQQSVLLVLDYLTIRYSTERKTFRHACTDNAWVYRAELERIAACGQGLLPLAEIEVTDTPAGHHLIRFQCNGRSHEWPIAHGPDEEFDAQQIFCWSVGELVPPAAPARWCTVDPGDPDVTAEAFFGDPAALNALGHKFGLTFTPIAISPATPESEYLQNWLQARQAGFDHWSATYGAGVTWDHSPASLEALGALVLRRTPTLDTLDDPANKDFLEGASWYLGEALLRVDGGQWVYRDGDPMINPFDGYPFIEQYGPFPNSAVPYRALRVLIKRADPHHLRRRYDDFTA
ncbi:hypothetical protein ACFVMC_13585 [Nocardia sp. NPDC127579]|uniref:hypothetical protein n=1 Tax=Nocardia sp. NPDC127579 TaxID=3345402 RepID=UPI0036309BC2